MKVVMMTLMAMSLGAGLLAGCGSEGAGCSTDRDCPVDTSCISGLCVPNQVNTCTQDADCSGGQVCNQGVCEAACAADSACPQGSWCSSGRCQPGCRADLECGTGKKCNPTTHQCEASCTSDSQCTAGHRCIDGACQLSGGCSSDAQCNASACEGCNLATQACASRCTAGQTCLGGQCQSPGCTQDSDCPAGQKCLGGQCQIPTCTMDADCPLPQKCINGSCQVGGCNDDLDCTSGQHCVNNTCQAGCITDNECAAGQTCLNGQCQGGTGCTSDAQCNAANCEGCNVASGLCASKCTSGQSCVGGVCQGGGGCSSDADCTASLCETCNLVTQQCASSCTGSQTCVNGTCQGSGGCIWDLSCALNEICVNFQCIPGECKSDYDCWSDERCVNYYCEAVPPCDLLNPACAAGEHCTVYSDSTTACVAAGTGDECRAGGGYTDDCPANQVCIGDADDNYDCYTVCALASGSPCAANQECTDIGLTDAGVCVAKPSCQSNGDCAGQVCLNSVCVPCSDPGAPACDSGGTCNAATGLCELPADQAVGDPCGEAIYGDCLPGLYCLGYTGFTSYCFEPCVPGDDPFCQPGNTDICFSLSDETDGYCDFGGDIPLDGDCSADDGRSCVAGAICYGNNWVGYSCTQACDFLDDDPGCPSGYYCYSLEDSANPMLGVCDW